MKRYSTLSIIPVTLTLSCLCFTTEASAFIVQEPTQTESKTQAVRTKLARQAKITKERAQEIALKRAPGAVESGELEREHGKLVYSFDIRNAEGTIDEVQVSAITGKIVRVEHETKKQEEAEKKKEQKP